jgi:surfeit locus 1 family protein
MNRRPPLIASLLVAAAVATMISLGAWQLKRAKWKERLFATYAQAEKLPPITWPTTEPLSDDQLPLFRHATGVCLRPVGKRAIAGENAAGETGYVQIIDCATGAEGPGMSVEVGWSKDPNAKVNWAGGLVSGIIVPDRRSRIRLVAASAPPGLQPSKAPEVESVSPVSPAGHRGYAATWFSLAVAALIIYGLALRKRLRDGVRRQ